ncbi:MAG TPA: hypothetical protein P5060_04300 [Candidatus Absconditabacterales bacterium]|nr:hypothetical protein [Candidatus Absconditabacterales bacterium]
MNYLYGFKKYAGIDKIWKSEFKSKDGDLIQFGDDFYLVLGKEVSFFEQYPYGVQIDTEKVKIIHKKLLNKQTLSLLHRMVYQRYSTYKNVVKLFLPEEVEKLIDKKIPKKLKNTTTLNFSLFTFNGILSSGGQNLIVFPDLRTLMNLTTEEFRNQKGVDTLLSTNTQSQKDKSWRNIKNGNTSIILATHSEIFQNYKDLQKIIIIRPHKRYYSNQKDPRYKTLDVVKKLSEIRDCDLEIIDT